MKTFSTGILIIIVALNLGGCRKAGCWLVRDDEPAHADAIVLLMGSIADRVLQTADLFMKNTAGKVIVVEESMGEYRELEARGADIISNTTQVVNSLITLGVPADSIIILPGDATSTLMEASIIKDYLTDKPDIDTILLVSSPSHTRRASIIFTNVFRHSEIPVTVYSSPSVYNRFDKKNWWKNREGIQVVLLEYIKIASFWVFERGSNEW